MILPNAFHVILDPGSTFRERAAPAFIETSGVLAEPSHHLPRRTSVPEGICANEVTLRDIRYRRPSVVWLSCSMGFPSIATIRAETAERISGFPSVPGFAAIMSV